MEKPEAAAAASEPWQRFEASHFAMGVKFRIVGYAQEELTARRAVRAAFDRIEELNRVFSDYDPQSEASQLGAVSGESRPQPVSPPMYQVLEESLAISAASSGAFDVTVGPISHLWRGARKQRALPDPEEIERLLGRVGYRHLHLESEPPTLRLDQVGMVLDFGGIAKGYAADEALRVLAKSGIHSALVDASGDITFGASPPTGQPWEAAVAPLESGGSASRRLELADCAVATSGDAFQYLEIEGRRFSHIIDPRTGWPLEGRMSVTVIAPTGSEADAWASALSVLGPEEGLALVEARPGLEALFVLGREDGTAVRESSGFSAYESQLQPDER